MLGVQRFAQGHFSRVEEGVKAPGWQSSARGEAQCGEERVRSAGLGRCHTLLEDERQETSNGAD